MDGDAVGLRTLYETGKGRRYNLLFAVNGGAFAILELIAGSGETVRSALLESGVVLGDLRAWHLAVGMALFDLVMTVDLYAFGKDLHARSGEAVFRAAGRIVLVLIGLLLSTAWLLAAAPALPADTWVWSVIWLAGLGASVALLERGRIEAA